MTRSYSNATSREIPVFADSAQSQKIGKLFSGSSCLCIGEKDELAIILYKVSAGDTANYKVGFADPTGIGETFRRISGKGLPVPQGPMP